MRSYISLTGLYLIRGWALVWKRQLERVIGARVSARGVTASMAGFLMVPLAYTAAYQPPPIVPPPPAGQVNFLAAPVVPPAAPIIAAAPVAPIIPAAVVHSPGTWRNGYAYGHCTYYVAAKRAVPRGWGHARTWKQRAEVGGVQTGSTPAVGAIAWTALGRYGHVAYVEAVDGASVTISEMNYVRWNRVNTRTVPANSFQYIY